MGISLQHNLSRSHSSLPVLLPLHLPYWFILFWVLPSPITQSYLGLMVWRTCRKDNGVVNVCRWCWMIGRWRRSVLFGTRSMALRIADKHLSAKQKTKKTKTIFEHEQRDKRKSTELGGGSEPCPCWLGIMMYGSDQTACWAIMWEQRPPPQPWLIFSPLMNGYMPRRWTEQGTHLATKLSLFNTVVGQCAGPHLETATHTQQAEGKQYIQG